MKTPCHVVMIRRDALDGERLAPCGNNAHANAVVMLQLVPVCYRHRAMLEKGEVLRVVVEARLEGISDRD